MSSRKQRTKRRSAKRGRRAYSDSAIQQRHPDGGLTTMRHSGELVPPTFLNYVRYNETWVDTTAGGSTYEHYRMNSIYDPYYQAGGAAIGGIDFMQSIYMRYDVVDALIEVQLLNNGTEPLTVYLYPIATTIPAPTLATSAAAPHVRSALVPNGTSAKPVILRHFMKITDMLGPKALTDMDTGATAGTNPTKCCYWAIYTKNVGGSAFNYTIATTIRYHVFWSDRQPAAASNLDG